MACDRTRAFAVSGACAAAGALLAAAGFLFGPEKIGVRRGQTIAWTDMDGSPHLITVQGEAALRTPILPEGRAPRSSSSARAATAVAAGCTRR